MRKHYLDNIRWATVLLVVLYHAIFMYNHVVTAGVVGPVTDCRWQDALQYLLYPWFMVVLFLVSGASARYALDSRSGKAFFAERTRKLLVPSTLGLLVLGWALVERTGAYHDASERTYAAKQRGFVGFPLCRFTGKGIDGIERNDIYGAFAG